MPSPHATAARASFLGHCLPALAVLLAAGPALAVDGPRWCSGIVAIEDLPASDAKGASSSGSSEEVFLERLGVHWDLDVRGAVATGTLTESFRARADQLGEARYQLLAAPGVEVDGHVLVLNGSEQELGTDKPDAAELRDRRRRPMPGVRWSEGFRLEPGSFLEVRSAIRATLSFREGWFLLDLPLVTSDCGPRSSAKTRGPRSTTLEVDLRVHHEDGPVEVESDSHPLSVADDGVVTEVRLEGPALVEEGAFALRYRSSSADDEEAELRGWASERRADDTQDLLVVLTPPAVTPAFRTAATDAVFVLDTSGSMKGAKLERAKAGLVAALDRLDEEDSFTLVRFASDMSAWKGQLDRGDGSGRKAAASWLAALEAEGGTQLTSALRFALGLARTGEHLPLVVVLTDGAIGDAEEVEKVLSADGGDVRVLFVGIGAEPQQDVLRRLAAIARGEAAFALEPADVAGAVEGLFASFSAPIAWDLELETPGAELVSSWPARLPDLYAGRPVTLFLRVRGALPEELRFRGSTVDGPMSFDRSLSASDLPEAEGLRGPKALEPRSSQGDRRR